MEASPGMCHVKDVAREVREDRSSDERASGHMTCSRRRIGWDGSLPYAAVHRKGRLVTKRSAHRGTRKRVKGISWEESVNSIDRFQKSPLSASFGDEADTRGFSKL